MEFDPRDLHPELQDHPGQENDTHLIANAIKAALLLAPLLPLIYAACATADWLSDRRNR